MFGGHNIFREDITNMASVIRSVFNNNDKKPKKGDSNEPSTTEKQPDRETGPE